MKKNSKLLPYIISIFCLILVWYVASVLINSNLILPTPVKVARTMFMLLCDSNFWKSFALTFCRILAAFFISSILGFITGYVFSKSRFVKQFFEPYVSVLQVTPVVALILIVTFWFKSYIVPVFVAVLMTLPVMTNAVYNGFMCVDVKLVQMSKAYGFSKVKTFFKVKLPAAKPSIIMGLESIFGLTWKVVVAGEVLCLPKFSIGTLLQKNSLHLETETVMAGTILLIIFCFAIQKIAQILLSCKEQKNNL